MYRITITKISENKNPNRLTDTVHEFDKELFSTDVSSDKAIELLNHACQLEKETQAGQNIR